MTVGAVESSEVDEFKGRGRGGRGGGVRVKMLGIKMKFILRVFVMVGYPRRNKGVERVRASKEVRG